MGGDRERLRATFGEDAERYDRARPGYPPPMFDDLAALAGLVPGASILEIGCGTGQATVPLVRRGYRVTAVELAAGLAAVARRNLTPAGTGDGGGAAEVVVAAFEDWPLPARPFDLVLAATAFHWIDPQVRVAKAADALRAGGSLAVVSTHHVAGGTEAFFVAVQACYERFDRANTPPGLRLPAAADVPAGTGEFTASGRFGPPLVRRYEWERTYTTGGYLDLLSTYSGHRALRPAARAGLFACVAGLIDREHGGQVTKRYMTQLVVAHRAT